MRREGEYVPYFEEQLWKVLRMLPTGLICSTEVHCSAHISEILSGGNKEVCVKNQLCVLC
jgi:hypothetical protein